MATSENETRIRTAIAKTLETMLIETGLTAGVAEILANNNPLADSLWSVIDDAIDYECAIARSEGETVGFQLAHMIED